MKIRKLEIIGFKSFVDRTVVKFDHEITAIVGPNGCGKSNIVDAIKWAMGEQSAQRLRGKGMEDVIFAGSENRGPHGFAEVSITFDNSDGLAPPEYNDYAEITITRRLDRQGHSEYLINRTPVRLMDITNLFLGTGAGRRAYSIIEQGRIGFIVSSKPEDRRYMIEEAAGVTKFKARKRAAERKMDQTRRNLLRVTDILSELERNLASLKRQAQKAERYRAYRSEMRDLELWVASHKWLELTTTTRVVSGQLHTAQAEAEGTRAGLQVREAELEAERTRIDQAGAEVERAQNEAYELDNRVRMLEGQIQQQLERLQGLHERERIAERELSELGAQREGLQQERAALATALEGVEQAAEEAAAVLARETEELERRRASAGEAEQSVTAARARVGEAETRIARAEAVLASFERRREEARARLDKLRTEQEQLGHRQTELAQEGDALRTRLEGLRSGKEQTAQRREQLEAELAALREEIHASDRRLEQLRDALAEKRSRLRSLEEIQQRYEGVGAGVRALMTKYGTEESDRGLKGLVADRIECPPELTRALAGALGDRLQHIVTDRLESGMEAVGFLRDEGRGRATLVPRTPRRVVGARPALPSGEGVIGSLADRVRCDAADRELVQHLLGHVVVVESLEAAVRLHRSGATDALLVTLDGEVVHPDGTLTGGRGEDAGEHMLEVKREIRELHGQVAALDRELGEAVQRHGELRQGIAERQGELDGARSQAHDHEIAIVTAEKDLRRTEEELGAAQERSEAVAAELADLSQALEVADDEEGAARTEIESAKGTKAEAEQALQGAEEVHAERRRSVDEQATRVTEVRVRTAEAQQRVASDRAAVERLTRSIEELDAREGRLRGDVAEGAREQGRIAAEVVLLKDRLNASVREAMEAHERLGAVRARYDEMRHALGEREVELKELRTRLESFNEQVNELTLRARELGMEMEHLLDQIEERHRTDLRKVLGDYHLREVPDASVTDRLSELQRLIERMGEINLTAIEEYEEKSQRYEYLKGQEQDLEAALRQLDRAIREMNRESRRLFRDAFQEVNARFKAIFPQMFRGGKAELRLTDPNDLLESGVEIAAQPPGKKLGSLELMSGGEKALTAVALIFALFQYHPSPFCLLDEVDAPLDEANISRFAEAVRHMTDRSQFILITHSKATMEYADVLYGVTMEEPGISNLVAVELRSGQRPAPVDGEDEGSAAVA
ncbi:MAG: chromosome segregation protein SMC [Myxococcota bacterium]